jgi:VIT1/CCC1 family predicted Fe2+/Mn2+ transporter
MNAQRVAVHTRGTPRLPEFVEHASVREVLMGAQDNLTNVLAVVLGVVVGSGRVELVALAGLSAAVAEAISMAGVLYTSTLAERELDERDGAPLPGSERIGPRAAGVVTGLAALIAGLIPLAPFAFLPLVPAMAVSLALSFTALFGLGIATATITRRSWWRGGMRLVVIAGAAAIAAAIVGAALPV